MRLIRYEYDGAVGVGVQVEHLVYPTRYRDMLSFIKDGDDALDHARASVATGTPVSIDRTLAPIDNPGKIIGSGVNYRSHGDEEPSFAFPDEPVWDFIKVASAIIGPGDPIVIPPADDVIIRNARGATPHSEHGFAVDYEVEFGVVIGRTAKNVGRGDALAHVFGYTVFNDVGARSVQMHHGQRDLAKNFDTFCPMGPCIVTADELDDWSSVRIRSYVNGQLRQDAVVGEQIAPPPVGIEWLSSVMRLDPGDCLMTGTPAGIGLFKDPPLFLQPGDVVTVAAEGIGELTNPVVAGVARTVTER